MEEVQPEDPGSMLSCREKDLFDEEDLSDSQLVAAVSAPTQGDPKVPAWSQRQRRSFNLDTFLVRQRSLKTPPGSPEWRGRKRD